jgi:hypothetical protein
MTDCAKISIFLLNSFGILENYDMSVQETICYIVKTVNYDGYLFDSISVMTVAFWRCRKLLRSTGIYLVSS